MTAPAQLARVFVASSREGQEVARSIQSELDRDAEVVIWNQNVFQPSQYTLESLIDDLANVDFGLFVLTPDDVAAMRGAEVHVARDNVILELGIFLGRLGRQRAIVIKPRGVLDLHLPTDLDGWTTLDYDPQKSNLQAAVGPACTKMRTVLKKLGRVDASPNPNSSAQADMTPSTSHVMATPTLRERRIVGAALWISDLALETQVIRGREFDDCEINGPAMITLQGVSQLVNSSMEGDPRTSFLELPEGILVPAGVIVLLDCVVRGCRLRRITFAGTAAVIRQMREGLGLTEP